MLFNELELQNLLGSEAAEDDTYTHLSQFFIKTDTYSQLVTDLPLRIVVGFKGVGKSALFKMAIQDESTKNRLTLLIKPNDITEIGSSSTDLLQLIRDWKNGIRDVIIQKIITHYGLNNDANISLNSILSSQDDSVSKDAILKNFTKNQKISIYLDDLDRGWEGRRQDIRRIAALISGIRDLATENPGIYFRMSLRSDIYYAVRTEEESLDKIESTIIRCHWNHHGILALLVKRILIYLGRSVSDHTFNHYTTQDFVSFLAIMMEPRFTSVGQWADVSIGHVLTTLIRKQPRDLIKLLILAGRHAKFLHYDKIRTENIIQVLKIYSQGRLQDTINEYKSELPQIKLLLTHMLLSLNTEQPHQPVLLTQAELSDYTYQFLNKHPSHWMNNQIADVESVTAFLYRINFLVGVEIHNGQYIRHYFDESFYLADRLPELGYVWEIHPAFRWAFYPGDPTDLFYSIPVNCD